MPVRRYVLLVETLMQITGTLDGRTGSFVLTGSGNYDGTTAAGESRIVPGSGTGDLAGTTGTLEIGEIHDDGRHEVRFTLG